MVSLRSAWPNNLYFIMFLPDGEGWALTVLSLLCITHFYEKCRLCDFFMKQVLVSLNLGTQGIVSGSTFSELGNVWLGESVEKGYSGWGRDGCSMRGFPCAGAEAF